MSQSSVEMDSSKFFKLMGDSGLTGRSLSRTDCDLMFTKTCAAAGCVKKISYQAFRQVRKGTFVLYKVALEMEKYAAKNIVRIGHH